MAGWPRNSRRGGSRPWLGPRVPSCGSGPEMLRASLPALSAPSPQPLPPRDPPLLKVTWSRGQKGSPPWMVPNMGDQEGRSLTQGPCK